MKMTGWKTKLGAALLIAAGVARQLPYEWAEPASELLTYIGGALTAVGVAHKIEKGQRVALRETLTSVRGRSDTMGAS